MIARTALVLAVTLAGFFPCSGAETPPPQIPVPDAAHVLQSLRKEHPRLLVTAADFARVKEQMGTDPLLVKWHKALQDKAAKMLTDPPSTYEIPDGLRLLDTSRHVRDRVETLALLYKLDGDKRYIERLWLELKAAADFQDWNPRHFLDTAEMTSAFAIAYDWLYNDWTQEQRAILQKAMVDKGIKPAFDSDPKFLWWKKSAFNWNQVCNGGIGMGALALADVEPELASAFLSDALRSIQLPMAEYGPDGAWSEGPAYWDYATKYNVDFLASLQTALGSDFGLAKIPGFSEAGTFPIFVSGPAGLDFNYADSHAGTIRAAGLFWLAREFQRPGYAWYESNVTKGGAFDMLWYDAKLTVKPPTPPLDKYFRRSEVVTMRSAWDDRNALFVGFKAGDNKSNHSHLDMGSFVLDALGVRWAAIIGSDNYSVPGYFGKLRWTYYRLRAEGHNTLVLNPDADPDQDPRAEGKIVKFSPDAKRPFAIADLSAAYAKNAVSVRRGIAMPGRDRVLVQDELKTRAPADLWWSMHTGTDVKVSGDGTSALLTKDGAQLSVRILSPAKAVFKVMDAVPLPGAPNPEQNGKNDKYRKLTIELKDVTETTVAVVFTPLKEGVKDAADSEKVVPLERW